MSLLPPVSLHSSKCAELEEELKNVTNNLKSLEAQAEKVGPGYSTQTSMAQHSLFCIYTGDKLERKINYQRNTRNADATCPIGWVTAN